jgi:hypothetical protein
MGMTAARRSMILVLLVALGTLLSVGGAPVAATGGPAVTTDGGPLLQPVETAPNTTRSLQLDGADASGTGTASVSVTNALQAEAVRVEMTLDRYALEERLSDPATDDAAALRGALDRTAARIDAVASAERAARDRFRNGAIDPSTYLATLGAVNGQARAIEDTLEAYEELTAASPALQDRVAAQQTRTVRYTGPIADRAGTAVAGGGASGPVFASVSDSGMALASLRDGTFTREVMRTDARDDAVGGVDLDAAQTRIAELYPWAWAHKGDVSINTVGQDVFRFQLSHGHGELNSLLDTSSGNVYREIQTKSLSGLPVSPGPSRTVENTTVRVSAAQPGWPVRIDVRNQTDAPVSATVSVNGTSVGTTAEGPVWVLSPTEPFTVTASTDDQTIEVEVSPSAIE